MNQEVATVLDAQDEITLISDHLQNPVFQSLLEARDLRAIQRALSIYQLGGNPAINGGSPLPRAWLDQALWLVGRALAIAGYAAARYGSLAEAYKHHVERSKAAADTDVRNSLAGLPKITETLIANQVTLHANVVAAQDSHRVASELHSIFVDLKFSLNRFHDSILEISRNDRAEKKLI